MTTSNYAINAHAKVNLRLKIVARRDDGYHLLSMLNLIIELADQIELSIETGCTRRVSIEVVGGCGEAWESDPCKNLAARAAQIFLQESSIDANVKITLTKKIPIGAGLGGGSADAAAVLRLLAAVFGPPSRTAVGQRSIEQLALDLGADVPYLLDGRMAIVLGIGEKIFPLAPKWIYGLDLLLIVPPFALSTAQVFAAHHNTSNFSDDPRLRHPELNSLLETSDCYPRLLELMQNDLEQAACNCAPGLAKLLNSARQFTSFATVMSGSGSAFIMLPRALGKVATLEFDRVRVFFEQLNCRVFASSFVSPQQIAIG